MRQLRRGTSLLTWGVWLLTALAVCGSPAAGAQRMVLCEEFTATWCTGCPAAGEAMGTLMDADPDTFVLVQMHIYDDYDTEWGIERSDAFYDVSLLPTGWFDGLEERVGYPDDPTWEDAYAARAAVPTDVTIRVGGTHVSGQTYRVWAEVAMEAGGSGRTLRVYMVQVLDHWPDPEAAHERNAFKEAAPTQDIVLAAGESEVVEADFTLDADSWAQQEDVKIVVWAQEPLDVGPAEVDQAAVMTWPFQPLFEPGDFDEDGDVDLDDYAEFDSCLGGPDPVSPPSATCRTVFDSEPDGDVDLADFGAFVTAFTGP